MTAAKTGDAFATLPRHALRASSTTLRSSPSHTALALAQASIWSKGWDDLSACYPDSECTSPGLSGTDCWAGGAEPCSCSRGYAKTTGEISHYAVCSFPTQGTCRISKGVGSVARDCQSDNLPSLPHHDRVTITTSTNAARTARARKCAATIATPRLRGRPACATG